MVCWYDKNCIIKISNLYLVDKQFIKLYFQKRRQKENQPPGNVKPEDLDKELLHALKADNNLSFWENIKVGDLLATIS